MISHLSLETRAKVRRGDVPKSGPKHKLVAFVSTFILWMKKLIIFCILSIGIYLVNVIVFTELWDHFFGRGREFTKLANHVETIFFDAVSSYVTVMMHSFIKTNSLGLVLKKKKRSKGFVNL